MPIRITLRVKGPSRDEAIPISLEPTQVFTIGRRDCQLNLDDKRVSRRHLSLSVETGDLVADDLGSQNGTYFNGQKISTQNLREGDTLELGDHTLTIEVFDSPVEVDLASGTSPEPPSPASEPPHPEPRAHAEFSFYQNHELKWNAIQNTFLHALRNWSTYWEKNAYAIPFETSLPVLAVLATGYGLVGALHTRGMLALLAAASMGASTLGLTVILAALLAALKEWLSMEGTFEKFIAYGVYAAFLFFPIALLGSILGNIVLFALGAVFLMWLLMGFMKAFRPNPSRFFTLLLITTTVLFGTLGALGFMIYRMFQF
jgi:hypothetical protein